MKQRALFPLAGLAALAVVAAASGAGTVIKKCQDATGHWHYGDTAAAACANTKVIVIDGHGVKQDEIAPPATAEELERDRARRAELEQAQEQAKRDEMLLTTYAHEADIIYIRDRRLAQLETMIQASADTLKPLRATLERLQKQAIEEQRREKRVSEQTTQALEQTRAQIGRHEAAIQRRREEQEAVRAQAQADLERYRELTSRAPGPREESAGR